MSPEPPVSLWPDPLALGTLTDLYELTMMAGYDAAGMAEKHATFELFVRKMPAGRAYLVFAGLEQAVGDLLNLAFAPSRSRRSGNGLSFAILIRRSSTAWPRFVSKAMSGRSLREPSFSPARRSFA